MFDALSRLLRDRRGNVAVVFGLVSIPFVILAGGTVDYTRATSIKSAVQQALDAGVLAAARNSQTSSSYLQNAVNANLSARGISVASATLSTATSNGALVYKGDAAFAVTTSFLKIVGLQTITVHAHAEATAATQAATTPTEIALVLDVSSSMIEKGRFTPMQDAVTNFIDLVSNSTTGLSNWKMSIAPFSSRISFGVDHSDWRTTWNDNLATPTRWTNPSSVYGSSYSKIMWTDGVNFTMYNGTNYYWMGCVEPRIDFAIHTGASTANALTDAAPTTSLFVPMDDNSQSGKSFCPPPITPLTNSASSLKSNVTALTSEGSTRLDAGMLGGWYTISPNWATAWGGSSAPAAYSAARKFVVFMTDGQMNTQDDPTSSHYDWICEATSTCDAYANNALLSVCDAMKAAGVTIFTIAYDGDADTSYIKSCASSTDYFYVASSTASGATAIKSVYAAIVSQIVSGGSSSLRLTK
jgi:Flp pilus assembly protein TadG